MRIARTDEQGLEWLTTFFRIARPHLLEMAVSFEWPKYCDGRQQKRVRPMISELSFIPISADGFTAGVVDMESTPVFKPWRVMFNDIHLVAALSGFKCTGDLLYRQTEEASRSRRR